MNANSRRAVLLSALWLLLSGGPSLGQEWGLTFFGWSDQHVQTNGDASHLVLAIEAMNQLPGKPYPPAIGGRVASPAFVIGCGDITEWPTHAAVKAYEKLITQRLKFPTFDIAGNHDEGGASPSQTMLRWLIGRHGALCYSFDKAGVRFIMLFSKYDENLHSPAQPIHAEALGFLRKELSKTPKEMPVVVAMHLCYDAITNREELLAALANANVVAVLGGHYHQAKVDRYRGVNFVQLPSPAKNGPGQVMVFRITSDRFVAIPWSYRESRWIDARGKMLDTAIRGPANTAIHGSAKQQEAAAKR